MWVTLCKIELTCPYHLFLLIQRYNNYINLPNKIVKNN